MGHPLIGITADIRDGRHSLKPSYVDAILAADGVPMILPPYGALAEEFVDRCDGVLLTGGDDRFMEVFGVPTHPGATRVDPLRQEADLALLDCLDERPDVPVLAVCLGMQLLGLRSGGSLHQELGEVIEDPALHMDDRVHRVAGDLGSGLVTSWHHQALAHPGCLEVVARSEDGLIEAIQDPGKRFCIGIQWHPERTEDVSLGQGLIRGFVDACRGLA